MRIKKARILLKELNYIYEGSNYKKDFAFYTIENVLLNKKEHFTYFNGHIQINKTFKFKSSSRKSYICYFDKITQVLDWLGIKWYSDSSIKKKKDKFIRFITLINFNS